MVTLETQETRNIILITIIYSILIDENAQIICTIYIVGIYWFIFIY